MSHDILVGFIISSMWIFYNQRIAFQKIQHITSQISKSSQNARVPAQDTLQNNVSSAYLATIHTIFCIHCSTPFIHAHAAIEPSSSFWFQAAMQYRPTPVMGPSGSKWKFSTAKDANGKWLRLIRCMFLRTVGYIYLIKSSEFWSSCFAICTRHYSPVSL